MSQRKKFYNTDTSSMEGKAVIVLDPGLQGKNDGCPGCLEMKDVVVKLQIKPLKPQMNTEITDLRHIN